MRSITFINLAVAIGLSATGARAELPELGCYERIYSAEHLKKHPDQVVSAMRMRAFLQGNETLVNLEVLFANQGHVKRAGLGEQLLDQQLFCSDTGGTGGACAVECDGGSFRVVKQDDTGLTFETRYLMVGETENCGGALDLAEQPDTPVRYRLNRAANTLCGGL